MRRATTYGSILALGGRSSLSRAMMMRQSGVEAAVAERIRPELRGRLVRIVAAYPELLLVLLGAGVGLAVGSPLRWVDAHQGINVLLALLVFATAVTVSTGALGGVSASWPQLVAALAIGAVLLPGLSWLASRLVAAGSLQHGIMAIGLAPCEIASVATTGLAGGEPALAAAVLIGSTALSVTVAGPILALEAGGAHVHPGQILINLAIVVALPLAAGLVLRAKAGTTPRREAAATKTAMGSLAGLVTLVAAEVHLAAAYLAVLAAIVIIVAVSAAIGIALGRTTSTPRATSLLLTLSMRDFAIAAGLATAAFGAGAAAPLGLYGVVVIVWGTGVAGRLRAKRRLPPR
jgi:ACR3 family arsenite efflux pump ArsB